MHGLKNITYYSGRFIIGWIFFGSGLANLWFNYQFDALFSGHASAMYLLLGIIIVLQTLFGFMLLCGLKQKLAISALLLLTLGLAIKVVVGTPINSLNVLRHHAVDLSYHLLVIGLLLFMHSHPRT